MVLNDAGVIGFSSNGKSFPATAPIIARPNEWIQIHYFNEGLQLHPMHLHGVPQLVVAKDGFPLPEPVHGRHPEHRARRAVHRARPTRPTEHVGVWAFHCHILNHAEATTGCSEWSRR